ncbi:MAG: gamma-glutamyltransferase, partial [Rhodothermales bacterium]|nr:gamma-glutamyltransferase [Rhodothermales bacterium]
MPRFICPLLLFLVLVIARNPASAQSGRQPVEADNGMVVSTQYLASDIGRDILMKGGNAVDAAVATAFALAVVHPAAGNIGGGGFLVYHGADGETTAFNFREKAPLAATRTMYIGADGDYLYDKHHNSIFAVGVPGTVAGLELAHQRLGALPWADLVEPAVRLAEDGFPFTRNLRSAQRMFKRLAEEDPVHQPAAEAFLKNGT